jgi:tetratricopeptide (TPR) repeat protein
VHLHQFEAVTLFIERAQAVRPDFFATNENAPAIAEICARLDGLPLAIELAAARVSLLTPLSILERLGRILDLPSTYTDLPHRQRTLRSTIDWSYRLLNGLEKTLLRESSVFAGGATLEALENVCTCGGEGPGPILQTLSALVSKSLLVLDDRSGSPRFVKMESIREFALELLDRDGAAAAVRQAHARYFLELVETTEQMLRGERQKESFDSLERELVNIRSALDWMMESHDTESELRLCGSMGLFWQVRGYLSEGIESCARALAEKPPGPAPARARALLASGMLARALGDPERAAAALRESAVLYESAGDPLRLGLAYSYLGWSLYSANRLKEARESFLKLRRKGAEENPLLTANMELGLATVDLREGANDSARERLERSVQLFTAAGDTRQLAQAIGNLGLLSHGRGALHDSLGLMLRALSLQESLGDKDDLVIGHYNAGELLRELGEPARAIHYYEKAIARAARMGRRRMQSIALCGLAESHLATGEAARAADSARAALGVADGGSLEAGMAHLALGDIALSQGLAAEAKKQFETAQPLLDKASASEEAARAKAGVEAARSLVSKRKTRC